MSLRTIGLIVVILIISGCTSNNIKKWQNPAFMHPAFINNDGITIIADTCVMRDEIGDGAEDDYFVINESKHLARSLLSASEEYITNNGGKVRNTIVPFVCGVPFDQKNTERLVANAIGGDLNQTVQPFSVDTKIENDEEYIQALGVLSIYATQYGSNATTDDLLMNLDAVEEAAHVVANRTQSSKVLFLNIAGTTISQGKAVGQLLGQVAVGTLVGAATAGLGTGYALMYAPGGVRDAVYIGAALIDLESAVVNWSNGILLSADPLDVSKISNIRVLNELYFDLMYRSPISMEMEKLNIKRMVQKTKTPVCLIDLTNKEKKFDGLCRGAMLRNPQLVHRSIQEIFNGFLRAAGLYNYHDGVKLSGSLDSIDLSCDMTGAWWDIQLSLSNDHGKTMQVQSRYEFDSFFNGTKSYNQAKDAFGPAVQKLIGEIINDPKFYELIELKAQPERVSTADH